MVYFYVYTCIYVISGEVSSWMTKGRTCLIVKEKSKGALVSNFRPITCLPIMWKLLKLI